MTPREFLTNVSIILTVMAAGALLELGLPLFAAKPWKRDRRAANLGLTALAFILNWLLASVSATAALTLRPAGLMTGLGWGTWAQMLTGILVLDFSAMWPRQTRTMQTC